MKRDGSIDRTLEAWFLDGPNEMPERVFDAVFERVEREPQRRLLRLKLRFFDMTPTVRWIVAGAAAILIAGVGFAAVGASRSNVPGGPAATASPAPSASAKSDSAAVPDELRHAFLGTFRSEPAAPTGQDRSILEFSGRSFSYDGNLLRSTASAPAADQVEVVSINSVGGCAVGDAGIYRWSAAQGGSKVEFTLVRDDCAARAAVIPGDWLRSACRTSNNFCLGSLEPGDYASYFIDPLLAGGSSWKPRFEAITYSVPAGWANSGDWPSTYTLMRQSAYATFDPSKCGIDCPDSITVLAHPVAARQNDKCESKAEPGVDATAAGLLDWMTAHPGLVTSSRRPVTISGRAGTSVEISLAPTWTGTCPETPAPFVGVPLLTAVDDWHWAVAAGDRQRLIVFEVDGQAVVIAIDTEDPATLESFADEAMPIIETFQFH
jgi:hypothetical protein